MEKAPMQGGDGVGPQHADAVDLLFRDQPGARRDALPAEVAQVAGDDGKAHVSVAQAAGQFVVARAARLVRRNKRLVNEEDVHPDSSNKCSLTSDNRIARTRAAAAG